MSWSSWWSLSLSLDFPPITYTRSYFPRIRATCPSHLLLLDFFILIILGKEYKFKKFLVTQFSPLSRHFIPLQSKYSPQHLKKQQIVHRIYKVYMLS
jgi:hypothetical protein